MGQTQCVETDGAIRVISGRPLSVDLGAGSKDVMVIVTRTVHVSSSNQQRYAYGSVMSNPRHPGLSDLALSRLCMVTLARLPSKHRPVLGSGLSHYQPRARRRHLPRGHCAPLTTIRPDVGRRVVVRGDASLAQEKSDNAAGGNGKRETTRMLRLRMATCTGACSDDEFVLSLRAIRERPRCLTSLYSGLRRGYER